MSASAPPAPPTVKLSSAAMMGIIAIVGIMAALIFGYILFLAPIPGDLRLWWTGFVAFVLAFIAYLVYAGSEARPIRMLAGGLFVIGAGSFYGSILTSRNDVATQVLWLVVLSVIVVIVLAGVFVMARQAEATAARAAQRRLTP